jgi:hypothetical protein
MGSQYASLLATPLAGALLLAGCEGSQPHEPDSGAPQTVQYSVGLGEQPGIVATVDGVVPDSPTGFVVSYESHEEAESAPAFHIETWAGNVLVDSIEIGFGACETMCLDASYGCIGLDAVSEETSAPFDGSGYFLGFSDEPRAWRQVGCLRCTFADGTRTALCT